MPPLFPRHPLNFSWLSQSIKKGDGWSRSRWVRIPGLLGWLFSTRTRSNSLRGDEWGREELMLPVTKALSINDDGLGQ